MRRSVARFCGMILLLPLGLRAQEIGEAGIRREIGRLGSADFAEREAAQDALLELGAKTIPFLEETLGATRDPEVQLRVRTLLNWAEWGVDRKGIDALGKFLDSFDEQPAEQRIQRIGEIAGSGQAAATSCLLRILRHDADEAVRRAAGEALGQTPPELLVALAREDPARLESSPELVLACALAFERLDRAPEAVPFLEKAAKRHPENRQLRSVTGRALTTAGRAVDAVPHLLAALAPYRESEERTIEPDNAEAALELLLRSDAGSGAAAPPLLASKLDPSFLPALGNALLKTGRPVEAADVFLSAVARQPEDWQTRFDAATALAAAGRAVDAVTHVLYVLTHERPDVHESPYQRSAVEILESLFDAMDAPAFDAARRDAYRRLEEALRNDTRTEVVAELVGIGVTHGFDAEADRLAEASNAAFFRDSAAAAAGSLTVQRLPDTEALNLAARGDPEAALARLESAADDTRTHLQRLLLAAELRRRDASETALGKLLAQPDVSVDDAEAAAAALDRAGFEDLRDRATARFADDPVLALARARVAVARGDLDGAVVLWKKVAASERKEDKETGEARAAREWLEALAALRGEPPPAPENGPEPPADNPARAAERGEWLAKHGRADQAEAAFVDVLDSDETDDWDQARAVEGLLDLRGRERVLFLLRVLEHRRPLRFPRVLQGLLGQLHYRPDARELTLWLLPRAEPHLAAFDPVSRGQTLLTIGDFDGAARAFTGGTRGQDTSDDEALLAYWGAGDFPRALAVRGILHANRHGWTDWSIRWGWEEEHRKFAANLPDLPATSAGALRALARLSSDADDRWSAAAEILALQGRDETALPLLRGVALASRYGWAARPWIVRALVRKGRARDAENILEAQERTTEPPSAAAWHVLAAELDRTGDATGARRASDRAATRLVASKESSYQSGQWLLAHGYPERARLEFEQALRCASRGEKWEFAEENAAEYLAHLVAADGRYAEAARLLHRAIDLCGRNSLSITEPGGMPRYRALVLAFWPAKRLLAEGKPDEARPLLEGAIRLDPEFEPAWELLIPLTAGEPRKRLAEQRRDRLVKRVLQTPLDIDVVRAWRT